MIDYCQLCRLQQPVTVERGEHFCSHCGLQLDPNRSASIRYLEQWQGSYIRPDSPNAHYIGLPAD